MNDMLTTQEFARLIQRDIRTVQRLIDSGVIPAQKYGRFFLIPRSALKLAQARKTTPGPVPGSKRKKGRKP